MTSLVLDNYFQHKDNIHRINSVNKNVIKKNNYLKENLLCHTTKVEKQDSSTVFDTNQTDSTPLLLSKNGTVDKKEKK